jgi:hypothetical protein
VRLDAKDTRGKLRHFGFVGLVFIASRLVILLIPNSETDVRIYARYAFDYEMASRAGEGFYAYHARTVQQQIDEARARGNLGSSLEEYRDVEYPPLALLVMRIPAPSRNKAGDVVPPEVFDREYRKSYRWSMAAVDVLLFVLVGWMTIRLFPQETPAEQGQRLLVYIVSTMAFWYLLYDRLDLVQSLLVLLALALLGSRRHYVWSFAVLAVAINFKLVPLVLAPLWAAGSLPARRQQRQAGRLLARGVILATLVLAIFSPFYMVDGNDSLGFLRYHRDRGLEIESLWGSVPLTLSFIHHPIQLEHSYASVNVSSPITPALLRVAPLVAATLLLAAFALVLFRLRRLPEGAGREESAGTTLAQLYPAEFTGYALLFLALFVCANKVFSPQYFLWLAPLVVLVPLEGPARRAFHWTFLLICVLTTIIVPFLFIHDLLDESASDVFHIVVRNPTPRLVALLLARNLLFLGWTVGLAVYLARRAFRPVSWATGNASN